MKEFPPFRLDPGNQCLWRRTETPEDERIRLTPKAFAVLQYLVEHAGRLVTHDELLEAVWHETYIQPEVLKNHIFDVRRALGDCAKQPRFIETRARRGYQFIAALHEGSAVDPAALPLRDGTTRAYTFEKLAERGALRGLERFEPQHGTSHSLDGSMALLNGMMTNDKFCRIRHCHVPLRWSRHPGCGYFSSTHDRLILQGKGLKIVSGAGSSEDLWGDHCRADGLLPSWRGDGASTG
jgi:DNA-binding winged helix-turn-helix (wHTH) protein